MFNSSKVFNDISLVVLKFLAFLLGLFFDGLVSIFYEPTTLLIRMFFMEARKLNNLSD